MFTTEIYNLQNYSVKTFNKNQGEGRETFIVGNELLAQNNGLKKIYF